MKEFSRCWWTNKMDSEHNITVNTKTHWKVNDGVTSVWSCLLKYMSEEIALTSPNFLWASSEDDCASVFFLAEALWSHDSVLIGQISLSLNSGVIWRALTSGPLRVSWCPDRSQTLVSFAFCLPPTDWRTDRTSQEHHPQTYGVKTQINGECHFFVGVSVVASGYAGAYRHGDSSCIHGRTMLY